jgi:hypothetical protein
MRSSVGRDGWPKSVASTGGKFIWKDDQETPNTQQSTIHFGDAQITFDVRNLPTPPEGVTPMAGPSYTGNIYYGDLGFMVVEPTGFQVYKSAAGNLTGARSAGAGRAEKYEKTLDEKAQEEIIWATVPHKKNFLDAVSARDYKLLNADIEVGARAAAFCHLANIAYRTGRTLQMSPSTGRFVAAEDANAMLTRPYRKPYVVPEKV